LQQGFKPVAALKPHGSNGLFFEGEARILVDWMNQNNISWVNWSFSNKDETAPP
jgi:hypothetical protein